MFELVLKYIIQILQPYHDYLLSYKQTSDTVLINSNFNCGFFINREVLYDILKSKYNIQAIYDPCSYPGIQCKFTYNHDICIEHGMQISAENKEKYTNTTVVSFMIFRTGSVLIVGMCDENILQDIYEFLTKLLKTEFKYICQRLICPEDIKDKKKKKIRKKIINIVSSDEEVAEKKVEEKKQDVQPILENGAVTVNNVIIEEVEEYQEIIPMPKKSKSQKITNSKK